jgi:phospho-N-acetylmuramoyl-pentapeptide-transferase
MGDVGAEALGAGLATVALVSGHMVLLIVAGLTLLSEAISVMIQVGYFKYTRRRYGEGRRVFRMAPLHHHFEALGGDELQITQRFWIATVIASLLALAIKGMV